MLILIAQAEPDKSQKSSGLKKKSYLGLKNLL